MSTRNFFHCVYGLLFALFLSSLVQGTHVYWISGSDGYFDDSANWNFGSNYPGSGDTANFYGSATPAAIYTVTFRQDEEIQRILIKKGSQTFELSGYTLTLNQAGASVTFGADSYDGAGVTRFQNGAIDNYSAITLGGGDREERRRELVLDNVVLTQRNISTNDNLRNINIGGAFTTPASPSGVSGHKLLITGGSEINNVHNITVGQAAGSERNDLEITAGSEITATGRLNIISSHNRVVLSGGSKFSTTTTTISASSNANESSNTFTISGEGTEYSTGWLQIGGATGVKQGNMLEVSDGAILNVGSEDQGGGAYLYVLGTGESSVLFNEGSVVNIHNAAREGYLRTVGNNSIIIDGAVVNTDQVRIASSDGSGLQFRSGELNVYNQFNPTGGVGDFTVGDGSAGAAHLNLIGVDNINRIRDLSLLSDSIISFRVEGSAEGEYARFDVSRSLLYGGALEVDLVGYTPELGDAFQLFSGFTSYSGSFEDLILPALGEDLEWLFDYQTGVLEVSAIPEPSEIAVVLGLFLVVWMFVKRRR